MATLATADLAWMRREIQPGDWSIPRAQFNLALQAVEDFDENTGRAAIGNAIESACPGVFTAAQKKRLVKHWLKYRLQEKGIKFELGQYYINQSPRVRHCIEGEGPELMKTLR